MFGEILNGEMMLSHYGKIVQKCWREINTHFINVETGAFTIMPNHVHGIILIHERRGTASYSQGIPVPNDNNALPIMGGETPPLRTPTLGQIVAYFKYQSTKEMNLLANTGTVTKFWQRNYYEHVIRDENDLQNKAHYIEANPLLWAEDNENPANKS
jgi:REP element-mobilizing transposase RayT